MTNNTFLKNQFISGSILRLALGASLFLFSMAAGRPSPAQAAPGVINFEGRLTDNANNPITSAGMPMTFAIYDNSSGGNQLWPAGSPEAQSVSVQNGVFSVTVGAVSALTPAVFTGDIAFLEVTVNGEPLAPRQRLLTSPYAFNTALLEGR